ncbi:MAG: SH3 domain-containing protein [Oscillospiraceae bacterium]|nr:SH3 domain-containing protein [Oscillospiraceae bacterium]
MKKFLSITLSAAIAAGIAAAQPPVYAAEADSMAGVVSTQSGRLNVRSSASAGASVIAALNRGSYVTLISRSGSWWKVEYAEGKYGYCHSDYIEVVSDNTAKVATQYGNLNVRSGAGRSYPVVDTVSKGENVVVLSSNGYWARILFDGTETGCVSADYLSPNENGYSAVSLSVPDFKQTDSRWANVKIGSSGKTIGRIGCVTTGIAMMESYRTGTTIYPNVMMKNLSYDSKGNVYWPADYQVNYWSENYLGVIYNMLKAGKPVLIGAKTAAGSQHWVVITGYTGGSALTPAGFTINDPGSATNTNLGQFFASFPYLYKFFCYE